LPSPRPPALAFYIDPENEEMKIAYPSALFVRSFTVGRAMPGSALTLTIGNNQGMGDVEYGKIRDIHSLRIAVSGLFCHDVYSSTSTRATPA
jgi:regulator of RNase E activity RraA